MVKTRHLTPTLILKPDRVVVELGQLHVLDSDGRAAVEHAAGDLATFLRLPVTVEGLNRSGGR